MPVLSTAQLAAIRSLKSDNYRDTAQIDRDDTRIASAQFCRLWPASEAPRLLRAIPGLGETRFEAIVMFPDTADVAMGDDVTIDGATGHVVGLGRWQTTIACALHMEPTDG